jgi:hypothetical protein
LHEIRQDRVAQASVSVPIGEFTNAVQVGFQTSCADAGTTRQYYADQIGLLRSEETSFAGPRRFELIYFRADSSNVTEPEVSFTIALNAAKYPVGSTAGVRLSLRSTVADPITLNFPSGQSYDLKLFNERGEGVYTWSADKLFPLIIRDEQFGPGERTYAFTVPLGELPPGRYRAEGYLTTNPQLYLGQTSFEIVP